MLCVEDWAEIRRLHRCGEDADQGDCAGDGVFEEHGQGCVGRGGAAEVFAVGPSGSMVDEVEPRIRGVVRGVSDDAGDGDRGADRLGAVDRCCGSGRGVAAGVSAAGSGQSRQRMSPGRSVSTISGFLISSCRWVVAKTRTAKQLPVLTMVTGYSRWLSAVLDPDPDRGGLVRRLVGACGRLGAVPRVLVWDGEGAVGRWRGGRAS